MSLITIRSLEPTDYLQWSQLWEGYNLFYKRTLSEEVTKTTWTRFLDPSEPMHAIVAERDGMLIGLTHYLFHRNTSMICDACYLQDLFTVDSARGQGVGRSLIEAVYERAKIAGSSRVYWQTHETNTIAMKLYDKIADHSGFVVYRKQL